MTTDEPDLLTNEEIPLSIFGYYAKYRRQGLELLRQLQGQPDHIIDSAFDLYNERLLTEGDIPDIVEVMMKVHTDDILDLCNGVIH